MEIERPGIPLYKRKFVLALVEAKTNMPKVNYLKNPTPSVEISVPGLEQAKQPEPIQNYLNNPTPSQEIELPRLELLVEEPKKSKPNTLDAMRENLTRYTTKFTTGTAPIAPLTRDDTKFPLRTTQEIIILNQSAINTKKDKTPTRRPQ